ncbi:hypothetical protein K435DRAFT_409873 [Dendrothele bispora CBS 962.96]|uniref:DUF6535 domain-containing protein n=1 Tax=Dendrothele bispora (strain CBS 962.96) TaxID=1314807 RepID=A0A4S8MF86_DENBC|nr:hypothetical protein K435DRAFT_409873 [Dendrothele bispora CBS 962.96]
MPHSQTVVTAHRESGAAKQSIGPDIEKGVAENEDRSKADEDACSKLWAVYAGEAEKYDGELLRGWKQDMEGLLIFHSIPRV